MPQATKRPLFSTATANKARALPKFQSSRPTPKNSSSYLDQLDPLLKLNKGGFTAIGSDTSSNTPFAVGGARPIAVEEAPDQQPIATMYNSGGTPYQIQNPSVDLPDNPFSGTQQDVNPSIDDFMGYLDQVLQGAGYGTPEAANLPNNGANAIASMNDGGVLFDDGMIRYDDGSEREYSGQDSQPVQSMADGSIRYSDNTYKKAAAAPTQGIASVQNNLVRQSDGSYRNGPYLMGEGSSLPGGTRGLISGIFGQDRTITQEYGNINPMEPTAGHVNVGTDIRTRDLQGAQRDLKLPVGATVKQVFRDDGTRFGDKSGHQGYGNSLLLELPSGELLRFSHLSKVLDVQVGDRIEPNEVFGNPGTTGNTAGEHLDLEYYNKDGRPDNPVNFSGFTDTRSILPNQPVPGSVAANPNQQMSMANQPSVQQPQTTQAPQAPATPGSTMMEAAAAVPNAAAGAINKFNPTGSKLDLGVTEALQGDQAGAAQKQRETIANVGTALKAPELQTNELSQEQGTNPIRQLAGNLLDTASTPLKKIGVPDFGISEAVAGGKTVNTNASLAPSAYASDGSQDPNQSRAPMASDYADVLGKNFKAVGDSIKTTFSNAVEKPIEGINKLKTDFQTGLTDVTAGLTNELNKIGPKKAVGEESGGDTNILGAPAPTNEKNDIRDAFFKLGGADTYGSFINKDKIGDGALSLDLFKPDFYKDANNVANVFGSTFLLKPAQDKFKAFEAAKYPKMGKMGYEDGYDRGAIDDYNRQIEAYNASIDSYLNSINLATKNATYADTPGPTQSLTPGTNFSLNVSGGQKKADPNLFTRAFSLSPFDLNAAPVAGGSAQVAPMSMARPGFSPANASIARPSISKPGPSFSSSSSSLAQPQMSGGFSSSNSSLARPASVSTSPAKVSAPVFTSAVSSVNKPAPKSFTPQYSSVAPKPAAKANTNIFSSAVNAVKKLFGR